MIKLLKKAHIESNLLSQVIFDEVFAPEYNRQFDMHDMAIVGLFEDMHGKIGSLIRLIDVDDRYSLNAISRMVMENYVYLKYILEKETYQRGRAYLYSSHLKSIKIYQELIDDNLVASDVRSFLNTTKDEIKKDFKKSTSENFIGDVTEGYAKSLGLKSGESRKYWYNFNGKLKSFKALCKYLELEVEYMLYYQIYSGEVHGLDSYQLLKHENNMTHILKGKHDPLMNIGTCYNFLNETVELIYDYYGLKKKKKEYKNKLSLYQLSNKINLRSGSKMIRSSR
ncbi:DUF5677 domain-containing protein [Cytobacillus sp. FSL R5-0569]|uniref:DUF5677 domain-containing protein n=1 Tax=Cytobacillus sp. FSL R5-0569 TaxID=2921649 RepID=UPI0030FA05C1